MASNRPIGALNYLNILEFENLIHARTAITVSYSPVLLKIVHNSDQK